MLTILQDASLGTFGTDMFVSALPDVPGACVAAYDSGSWREPNAGLGVTHPLVQIVVRGQPNTYERTYLRAAAIRDLLLGAAYRTVSGVRYNGFWASSDIASLGYDEQRRPKFSLNFRLMRSN
jgi:hypothetical protein